MRRALRGNMMDRPRDAAAPPRRWHGGAAEPGLVDFSVSLNRLGPPDSLRRCAQDRRCACAYPEPASRNAVPGTGKLAHDVRAGKRCW